MIISAQQTSVMDTRPSLRNLPNLPKYTSRQRLRQGARHVCELASWWPPVRPSKHKFDPELHLPGRSGAEDAAKVRCAKNPIRHIEVHTVEEVEDFPPQFEARASRQHQI